MNIEYIVIRQTDEEENNLLNPGEGMIVVSLRTLLKDLMMILF